MFTTASNTFVSFVMGGLAFWAPLYVIYAVESKNQQPEQ
jgi:F0F1-type ATP synthase assembly protein I